MAEDEALDELRSKCKAFMALLPYAVWQERDGDPQMLNMFPLAARASKTLEFGWHYVDQFAGPLFFKARPCAVVLSSPHMSLDLFINNPPLVRRWAAAASEAPYAEGIAQSVVNELLWIASSSALSRFIATDVWSWLKRRPTLPPTCWGRHFGTSSQVVKVVRGLKDVEVLKSYLLLAWSEWNTPRDDGFNEMRVSIHEDFCGIGMGRHRADLIKHLDHVLGELGGGFEYLELDKPDLSEGQVQDMKRQYQRLREALLEINIKANARMSSYPTVILSRMLIQVGAHRISRSVYVRASSPVSVTSRPEPSRSFPSTASFILPVLYLCLLVAWALRLTVVPASGFDSDRLILRSLLPVIVPLRFSGGRLMCGALGSHRNEMELPRIE